MNPIPRRDSSLVRRFMPGLDAFSRYEPAWLSSDVAAGLSVAAIALPVGIAYADLAGVPAVIGMYSAIFPLLAYALFGSSRLPERLRTERVLDTLKSAVHAFESRGEPSGRG